MINVSFSFFFVFSLFCSFFHVLGFFLLKSDQDYLLLLKSQDPDSWSESLSSIKTFAFELTEEDKLKHIKWNHLSDNSESGCTPSYKCLKDNFTIFCRHVYVPS